jgi:hypothetical protein
MKKLFNVFSIILVMLVAISCEDEISTNVSGVEIEDSDLIQVDDANPNVTVYVTAQGEDLKTVVVSVTPEAGGATVYEGQISKITTDKLNRVRINVPFPTPDIAPSGVYEVAVSMNGSSKESTTYTINVINNRSIQYCTDFPATPAGQVGIFVSVPKGEDLVAAGKDVYIVGDFMDEAGGAGDWNAGDPLFKLTRLSDRCYYIFLSKFDAGKKFKFTLGTWETEFLGPKGEGLADITHKGGNLNYIAYNFKTITVNEYVVPEVLPAGAIKSGHNTVVVNVGAGVNADSKYYLIEKGATTLDGSTEMFPIAGTTNKLAVAVPKGMAGSEFEIVKNVVTNIAAVSANPFGFDPVEYTLQIGEDANPMYIAETAVGFSTDLQVNYETFLLVGGSSPAGWDNSTNNTQLFTKVDASNFTITLPMTTAGDGYLIIRTIGDWDSKIGKSSGTATAGTVALGAGNFDGPPDGTYKIDLNLETATYTLTLQ